MTNESEQIITAFETAGMNPEQIAESYELDLSAVKAVLFQYSSAYRKEAKKVDKLQFTDDEATEMMGIIKDVARYAENEDTRLKAAVFVVNDKKGRLDVQKAIPNFNFNVISFNERMKQVQAAQARTLKLKNTDVIEAEEVK